DQNAETLLSSVTLVPDRHEDGTNVMVVPTNFDFEFSYGKNSFAAHQKMAKKYGLSVRILHDLSLAVDIDTADDLAVAQQLEI
ncbi:MAG: 2-phospho-L-lactate guanylyltransferase, partial [Actinomycetota bacterium]